MRGNSPAPRPGRGPGPVAWHRRPGVRPALALLAVAVLIGASALAGLLIDPGHALAYLLLLLLANLVAGVASALPLLYARRTGTR